MALTQQDKEEMYQYLITRGKALGSLDEGDSNLSNKYLAPVLEYSGGTASKAVRLAVSQLKGDSAYQDWVKQPGNEGKTLSDFFLSLKGGKGDPGAVANMSIGTVASGETPSASISGEAPNYKLNLILKEGEKGDTGKTPVLASVGAQSGETPAGNFTADGTDEFGNPKYMLNLTLPKGEQGRPGKDFQILGYYDTIADLRTAITSPEPGEAYGVGTAAPYPIYIWDAVSQDWVNNGAIQGPAGRSGKSARVNMTTGYWEEFDDEAQTWKQTEALGAYPVATAERDGLMSKEDKVKLDKMKGGDVEVSKANIEKVLTGNIASHSHDQVKQMVPNPAPTDVWDGITISTFLSGAGAKADPYLIASCADWLHFVQAGKNYSGGENIIKYIKLVKNLDFDNNAFSMPDVDNSEAQTNICMFIDIDGNGCSFKNVYFKNTFSILCAAMYSNVHNIGVDSGRFVIDVTSKADGDYYSIFGGCTQFAIYNDKWNCYCKASFETEGILSDDLQLVLLGVGFTGLSGFIIPEHTGYYGRNSFINRCDVTAHCIMLVYAPCMSMGGNSIMHIYDASNTVKPLENINTPAPGYYPMYNGMSSGIAFYNSDTISGILSMDESPTIDIAKTTTEMKSPDFLKLLNGDTSIFVSDTYNVNDGYPIFPIKLSEQVLYDGYVTASAFENALANLPGGSSSGAYIFDISSILSGGSNSGSITESQYTILLNAIRSKTSVLLYVNAGGMLASYPAYAYVINNGILLAALQITLGDSPGLFSGLLLSINTDYTWSKSEFNLKA